jgi:DNA-binding transcriptional MocR family regulator
MPPYTTSTVGAEAMSIETISFSRGVPDEESFPIEEIIDCAGSVLGRHGKTLLQYHPVRGFQPLREWIARREGMSPDHIMISNGSIQLFDLLARVLHEPGAAALVERPTYDRAITTLRGAGYTVYGVELEPDGMDVEAFERALVTHKPRLVYLIPDFQNPSGVTMSAEKRRAVAELAERRGALIVIDVPYRPLRYWGEDIPCLSELAPAEIVRLSSFSKLISPGIRVGWMSAPTQIVDQIARIAEDTYITPGMLSQGVVYEFLERGLLPDAIERLKALYAPRLKAMLTALEQHVSGASWIRPEGGFFLGLTLPEGAQAADVRRLAAEEGLILSDGEGFYADGDGSRFVRLPYCALSEPKIEDAVRRFARVVGRAGATEEE